MKRYIFLFVACFSLLSSTAYADTDGFSALDNRENSNLVTYGPFNHSVISLGGTTIRFGTGEVVNGWYPSWTDFHLYGNTLTGWWGSSPTVNAGVAPTANSSNFYVMNVGDVVGPDATYSRQNGVMADWRSGTHGYLGFRFDCSYLPAAPENNTCYGYMEMTTAGPNGYPAVIHGWAFDRTGAPVTIAELEYSDFSDFVTYGPFDHSLVNNWNGTTLKFGTGQIVDGWYSSWTDLNFFGTGGMNAHWGSSPTINAGVASSSSGSNLLVLNEGDIVGPESIFSRANGAIADWRVGVTRGYLGFRFDCAGLPGSPENNTCYGYMELSTTGPNGYPATVHGWTFNRTGAPVTIAPLEYSGVTVLPRELSVSLYPGETSEQILTITNETFLDVEWEFISEAVGCHVPWNLQVNPMSGTVVAEGSTEVSVLFDPGSLPQGNYNGTLCLETNIEHGSTIIIPVRLSVAGTVAVRAGESSEPPGWRMFSSPLIGATVQTLANVNLVHGIPDEYPDTPTSNLFTGYDGFNDENSYDQGFIVPSGLGQPLEPGRGFIWYLYHTDEEPGATPPSSAGEGDSSHRRLPFNINYSGATVQQPHHVTFLHSERSVIEDDGFYLIGNPTRFEFSVTQISADAPDLNRFFSYWNAATGMYELLDSEADLEAEPVAPHLAPVGAGFFAEFTNPPDTDVTFTFDSIEADDNQQRILNAPTVRSAPPGANTVSRATTNEFTTLFEIMGTLIINNHEYPVVDRTRVLLSDSATDSRDRLDANKLTPLSYVWANIAMLGNEGTLRAVESRPIPQEPVTIPMALSTYASGLDAGGSFTIALAENSLGDGWQVSLTDLETGDVINLLTDSYSFSIESQPAIDADQRFEITFIPPTVSNDGDGETYVFSMEPIWPNPTVSTSQVAFTLATPDEISVEVFDVLGRRVAQIATGEHAAGRHVLPLNTHQLASGVYVVRLTAGAQTAVQRVTVAR